jgi:hypothetical protein
MASGVTIAVCLLARPSRAVDVPIGDKRLTLDISNTTELGYHFDNRNSAPIDLANPTLAPSQYIDDNYGDWFNRLQIRAFYWKLNAGVRLDSALFFRTLSRPGVQTLIRDKLGKDYLALENRFNEELHSHYGARLPGDVRALVYPSKLWVGFKNEWVDATLGDYYLQLGRGLVFSVRKIDEVGVDTTVRGAKVRVGRSVGNWRVEATAFGGQLNPIRIDYPTGRILHGNGSPLFFGFPVAADLESWQPNPNFDPMNPSAAPEFVLVKKRAKPSYLEDNVVGGNLTFGPKQFEIGLNAVALFRQNNSFALESCKAQPGADVDACQASFPSFGQVDASRLHGQIRNFGASVRVPSIGKVVDVYVEGAGQHQVSGRVLSIGDKGTVQEPDLLGYAVYANLNVHAGPIGATLEGKHYRSFYALGANVDTGGAPFGAPEFGVVTYSRPPTAESIYVEPIGSPDICITGGRAKIDYNLSRDKKVYAWVGRFASWSELDANNSTCDTSQELRTDTWDTAAGTEISTQGGSSHYWGWIGARLVDRAVPAVSNAELPDPTSVFYREGYVRYDFAQKLTGALSLGLTGFHRYRFEPTLDAKSWNEGENLLALNWLPSFSFIFGYEYTTRQGFPTHYFNGAIQYRAKSRAAWWQKVFESARVFVGQRRAALRCAGGTCRVWPAFEGARLEIVSRF